MPEPCLSILNLEPEGYSPQANALLGKIGYVTEGPLDRTALIERISHFDIMIVRLGHQIDGEILAAAANLRIIVSATTGLNHIDVEEAEARGIQILSLQKERDFLDTIYATAEHTWALLLGLIRKLPQAHQHVVSGGWDRNRFKGTELHGRALGIIGMGRLGSKVAGYGKAFGMKVMGCDLLQDVSELQGVGSTTLEKLLSESEVISLHVNYTPENHGMINQQAFERMKPGALFINTARGELVDEAALLEALNSGILGGAALDVLCGEVTGWNMSTDLIEYAKQHENLILTPHIGGCTVDSMGKTEVFMAEKLRRFLETGH
jgi:D-3-phosphoglycerate dehydrogenase / 2-oxoglutarate reductase